MTFLEAIGHCPFLISDGGIETRIAYESDIPLDPDLWPLDTISGAAYQTLNATLECRAGTGPWVQPLRPPRVAIN